MVLGGTDDVKVSQPRENLTDWTLETSGPCTVEMLAGGHFFLEEQQDAVVGLVTGGLVAALSNRERARA